MLLSIGSASYGLCRFMLDSGELGRIRVNPDPTEWFGLRQRCPIFAWNSVVVQLDFVIVISVNFVVISVVDFASQRGSQAHSILDRSIHCHCGSAENFTLSGVDHCKRGNLLYPSPS